MPVDTAVLNPLPAGTWQAAAAELDLALRAPVVTALDELGVIAVDGAAAAAFLQAQLSNDSRALDAQAVQLNGYCTPKGRLLAVFDQWRDGDRHLLQLPREILAPLVKRLSMFVLRAKVTLVDDSAQWATLGLLGPGARLLLARVFGSAPAAGESAAIADLRVSRLPDGTRAVERFVLRGAPARIAALRGELGAAGVGSGVWWWSQIDAARPTVVAATQDAFVPQMINLEVLGGVNFKKGCYPGQEVVARSQYLGKLRRRMHLAQVDGGAARAGADVCAAGAAEPVGRIVLAAAAPGGGMDLLFEAPVEHLAERQLQLDAAAGGAPLRLRALPYPLVDVTA